MTRSVNDGGFEQECFSPNQYWEDRLSGDFSLRGVGYSLLGTQYNKWLYRLRDRVLRRALAIPQVHLSNVDVIDVGSGTGFYIDFWRRTHARSVSGCDLTETSVSRLRAEFPDHNFYQLDIGADLPTELAGKFDVVSAFDILFHIVDEARYEKAFHNFSLMLRPGGLLCFSEIYLHRETDRRVHVVFHSLSHIERLLSKSGFEILVRRPFFVVMNEPVDTQGAVLSFLWKLIMYPVRKSEMLGWLWGAALYQVELLLTKLLKEGPTTKIIVCRKVR
jgi:SAM-dependent methyltransferase